MFAGPSEEDAPALTRARELLAANRLWPAEQAAREAVALQPDSAPAHQLLGRVLDRRGRKEQALAAYERAWALDPAVPGLARELAIARAERGDCAAAREPYERAVVEHPDDAVLQVRLGLCEAGAGRPESAAEHFERALDDPVLGQLATYNLGLAQQRVGRAAEARETLRRAVEMDPDSVTGRAAAAALAESDAAEPEEDPRRWHLELGAGLGHDDNVVVEELDVASQQSEAASLLEASVGAEWSLADWEFDLGYDFSDTHYADSSNLDLQSHGLLATFSRDRGARDATLSYAYSYNTLGGDSFLLFHQLRGSFGRRVGDGWYVSPYASYSVKGFPQTANSGRDADQLAVGLLQLVALGGWNRYLTLTTDLTREDTEADRYTYWGPALGVGLRSTLRPRAAHGPTIFDTRYRFRWHDYRYVDPTIGVAGEKRSDTVHELRLRFDIPLARRLSLRAQYTFKTSNSNLPSADYESNRFDALVRFELK